MNTKTVRELRSIAKDKDLRDYYTALGYKN